MEATALFDFLLREEQVKAEHFSFSENILDFGSVSPDMGRVFREVLVENRRHDIPLCFHFFAGGRAFSLSEQSLEVAPGSKRALLVFFHPRVENKFLAR